MTDYAVGLDELALLGMFRELAPEHQEAVVTFCREYEGEVSPYDAAFRVAKALGHTDAIAAGLAKLWSTSQSQFALMKLISTPAARGRFIGQTMSLDPC